MFSKRVSIAAHAIIALASFTFALGAVLYRAASITHADSDYTTAVTWWSALTSVMWPPNHLPFRAFIGISVLSAFTAFVFFRLPRAISATVLFLQAAVGYLFGGSLGAFFLHEEFERYHFVMDAERLGEYWFTYEALAFWCIAAIALAALRLTALKRVPSAELHENPQTV
jgi:hypothetical protein